MKFSFTRGGRSCWFDAGKPLEISIPLNFQGPQPRSYGAPTAQVEPVQLGEFVGDIRQGGSCNVKTYTIIPHCNGTHTECVGHITQDNVWISDILSRSMFVADLVSVEPVHAATSGEHCSVPVTPEDFYHGSLPHAGHGDIKPHEHEALIIRTLPNGPEKLSRDYSKEPAAFLSLEAAQWIAQRGYDHLLLDVPSLDRASDEGKLSAHRIFWGLSERQTQLGNVAPSLKTITEFIYVPPTILDGSYVVFIEIPFFQSDAAPSRVRLFEICS